MKKGVFCGMLMMVTCWAAAQRNKDIPAEIKNFILNGYEALDYTTGDLNNDKKSDAILILKIIGEDTVQTENYDDPKRPMLLLLRQKNDALKLAARNDEVVMCRQCGGVFGDPYENVSINSFSFSLNFYGGSAWRWSHEYTFRYNAAKKDWFIFKESQTSYWNGDPEKSFSSATILDNELPDIPFSKYKPLSLENISVKYWKIKSRKAYFYDIASKKSNPLKAYMVQGDVVSSYRETPGFIFVEYENKTGKSNRGFIRKTDVTALVKEEK